MLVRGLQHGGPQKPMIWKSHVVLLIMQRGGCAIVNWNVHVALLAWLGLRWLLGEGWYENIRELHFSLWETL